MMGKQINGCTAKNGDILVCLHHVGTELCPISLCNSATCYVPFLFHSHYWAHLLIIEVMDAAACEWMNGVILPCCKLHILIGVVITANRSNAQVQLPRSTVIDF